MSDQTIGDAIGLFARDPVAGLRQLVDALCQRHAITVQWTNGPAVPGHAMAYADWRRRKIVTPQIVTVVDGATALHEIGHVLQGACPQVEPHRPDRTVARWWNCLACETDAWRRAMQLAPFTRAMHRDLQQSLRQNVRTTPAPSTVVNAARTLASDATFAQHVIARGDRERRLEQAAEMRRWAEEARRPRLITKLDRQIAQLAAWRLEDAQQ